MTVPGVEDSIPDLPNTEASQPPLTSGGSETDATSPATAAGSGDPADEEAASSVETTPADAAAEQPGGPGIAGSDYSSEDFQDWRLDCYDPPISGIRCQIRQQIFARDSDDVVLVASFAYYPQIDRTRVQIALPLGIKVASGAVLTLGATYESSLPIDQCTPQGCIVQGQAAEAMLEAIRQQSEGAFIVDLDGEKVRLPFSPLGFSEAFQAMRERNLAAAR